jgi:hypothetical protein
MTFGGNWGRSKANWMSFSLSDERIRRQAIPRETLIKSSAFHNYSGWSESNQVSARNEAEDIGDDDWFRAVHEEDPACAVSGRDGAGGAMWSVVCPAVKEYKRSSRRDHVNAKNLEELK